MTIGYVSVFCLALLVCSGESFAENRTPAIADQSTSFRSPINKTAVQAPPPGAPFAEQGTLSENLLDTSGLKKQILETTASTLVDSSQLEFIGVPKSEIAITDNIYARIFRPETYYQDVLNTFKAGFNKVYLTETVQWYLSPLGRKIAQLDQASQTLTVSAKVDNVNRSMGEPPAKPRLALIGRLEKGLDASSFAVATIQSRLQTFLPFDAQMPDTPMTTSLKTFKGANTLQERILVSLIYVYDSLSDEELGSFVKFVESPTGRWFFQLKKTALSGAQSRQNNIVSSRLKEIMLDAQSGKGNKQFMREILPPGTRYLVAQGRDPFVPLMQAKPETKKISFSKAFEDAKPRPVKQKPKLQKFGEELKTLHTIPLEIYTRIKVKDKTLYDELERYAFLFRDQNELKQMEDRAYLNAVESYKNLIDKANRLKGEVILNTPLQTAYSALKPGGVVWKGKEPVALIETRDNMGYTARKGTLIGPDYGVIDSIDQSKIMIAERNRDFRGNILTRTKELELPQPK